MRIDPTIASFWLAWALMGTAIAVVPHVSGVAYAALVALGFVLVGLLVEYWDRLETER